MPQQNIQSIFVMDQLQYRIRSFVLYNAIIKQLFYHTIQYKYILSYRMKKISGLKVLQCPRTAAKRKTSLGQEKPPLIDF